MKGNCSESKSTYGDSTVDIRVTEFFQNLFLNTSQRDYQSSRGEKIYLARKVKFKNDGVVYNHQKIKHVADPSPIQLLNVSC